MQIEIGEITIGDALRMARTLRGWSLPHAAPRLGLSPSGLRNYEVGARQVSAETVAAAADLYRAPWLRDLWLDQCPVYQATRGRVAA